ncbi:MAG: hypothetical protein U0441_01075 [Polyangiaceae bacterium]
MRWKRSSERIAAALGALGIVAVCGACGACGGPRDGSGTASPVVTSRPGASGTGADGASRGAESDAGATDAEGPDAGGGSHAGPQPACAEAAATPGPWERAVSGSHGVARAVRSGGEATFGGFVQEIAGRGEVHLRFLGTHTFDLLDKLAAEGGSTDGERRRVICAALNDVASRGAPVVRMWGTLKRTGSSEEIGRARDMLSLLLDENGRRARPLRFVVSLLNHQPGYGLPDPEVSLDDQKAAGWSAKEVYLEGGWQRRGAGQMKERIEKYREDVAIRESPYVLAWELVNELDTFRTVGHGSFVGPEADKLIGTFLVPASALLAESFPQPIVLADFRGALKAYPAFAEKAVRALPEDVSRRLVWTSHVYVETTNPAPSAEEAKRLLSVGTRKIDVDTEIAKKLGVPFLLGEIGQLVKGAKTSYCQGGADHDIAGLLKGVLSPAEDPHKRGEIDAALFWGEGMCGLQVGEGQSARTVNIGAGGDSADLGPSEDDARKALREARGWGRFLTR